MLKMTRKLSIIRLMSEIVKKLRCLLHQILNVSFNTDFHRRVKQAGIDMAGKKLTVHVLRKCCIQNWANSLPMNVIKELAGHSDI